MPTLTATNKKLIYWFSLAGIIFYPLIFIWQGLDLTDMGYCLVSYQNFFKSPFAVFCWCTCALGWLVDQLSFGTGIIAFRLAAVFINWLTLRIVYLLVKDLFSEQERVFLLPILFLTLVYCTRIYWSWFSYNHLTAFFYVLTAYFLYQGLSKKSDWYLFFAGSAIVVNIFVRFPNILGLGFITFIFFYAWSKKLAWRKTAAMTGVFLAGILATLLLILVLIYSCGHWEAFRDAVVGILIQASDPEMGGTHYSGTLIRLFYIDHLKVLQHGSVFFAAIWLFAILLKRVKIKTNKVFSYITPLALCLVICLALYLVKWKSQWGVPGVLYFTLIPAIFCFIKKDTDFALLAALSFAILVIAPLGSDNGIHNVIYGSWLAIPMTFAVFFRNSRNLQPEYRFARILSVERKNLQLAVMLMAGILLLRSSYSRVTFEFRDDPRRYRMLYSLGEPLSVGTFTTKERARVIKELLQALKKYTYPDMVVLGYNNVTTIHYLSRTIPYLSTPWPTLLPTKRFQLALNKQSQIKLPEIIFRATGSTRDAKWPEIPEINQVYWSGRPRVNSKLLDEFVEKHNYERVWFNDFFEIFQLTPQTNNSQHSAPDHKSIAPE